MRVQELALGEYYTSALIAHMIEGGATFVTITIPTDVRALAQTAEGSSRQSFVCVGTPAQLSNFLHTVAEQPTLVRHRRFCWDLDSTLVTPPRINGDYSSVEPIERNITLVRELFAAGHHIIVRCGRRIVRSDRVQISTARRMRTHAGNVSAVIADIGAVTLQTLKVRRVAVGAYQRAAGL